MFDKGHWVIRTYTAGLIREKTKFFVPADKARSKKEKQSYLKKLEQNEGNIVRRAARLINGNFTHEDYLVTLDYSPGGYDRLLEESEKYGDEALEDRIYKAADHQMKNYLRRLKRAAEKLGGGIKYLAVTSDMDGETKELVRVHHHIIVSGLGREALISKWTLGGCTVTDMWKGADQTKLAKYLIDQVRKRPDAKKYTPSRNLVLELPTDRIVHSNAELRVPKNAQLIHRGQFCGGNDPQYIRYIMRKVPGEGGGDV